MDYKKEQRTASGVSRGCSIVAVHCEQLIVHVVISAIDYAHHALDGRGGKRIIEERGVRARKSPACK